MCLFSESVFLFFVSAATTATDDDEGPEEDDSNPPPHTHTIPNQPPLFSHRDATSGCPLAVMMMHGCAL